MKKANKTNKPKAKKTTRKSSKGKLTGFCEKFDEKSMCYRCLDMSRELVLCNELEEEELKRVRKIMKMIMEKKRLPKKEVDFLGSLSEIYLS